MDKLYTNVIGDKYYSKLKKKINKNAQIDKQQ